eukprot:TRINITY_DN20457_c0_g1_i1.p1 TRINITY_DN20457_c0_g1~~TRINITY_DN20457_c0_g1_i1.p1  ORF type:complete len:411 (+),score=105.73 TRINITY_DN20457_c0_g1_i1:122-1354(+)
MADEDAWQWAHLTGGNTELQVADLCDPALDGTEPGRGCIVVQTNATSSFHVIFSSSPEPSRGSSEPVLRFVVGKRKNSMTSVGLGNPYVKKEPIDFTKCQDALLTTDEERSRTYWFLYDRTVGVAAMGAQAVPQADLCRLCCRFPRDSGFKAEICENVRYVSVSSGKRAVSLRIVRVCAPPDISIPRMRFDPVAWRPLPWNGCSCVFELDAPRRALLLRVQELMRKSPLAPFYGFVPAKCLCLNAYRLLDPLRRGELLDPERRAAGEEPEWSDCMHEVQRRIAPVLQSAAWTYWPLRFERADCTAVTLAPLGSGGSKVISEWCRALEGCTGLRNSATPRELLSVTFAYEVFPVVGEALVQARRDVLREVAALLQKEWGQMEFRGPILACRYTEHEYVTYEKYIEGGFGSA